ncbi:MAG: amino acid adenylation domain-containing protein, partial [Psychrosphaera sp.]|nr:amino acid adenylation domain-containing protein [Psychrosphaera sp.]
QYQVTLNTLLQGAWAKTLALYSNSNDVLFGVTVAGRSAPIDGIETMVGLFINTLPLRCKLSPEQPLGDWLQQLQLDNLELTEHEHTSLALIQQWSEIDNQPLFNSILVFENAPLDSALALDNLDFKIEALQNRSNLNYPLTVTVMPGQSLHLELTYRCSDFDAALVDNMLNHFKQILLNMAFDITPVIEAKQLLTQQRGQTIQDTPLATELIDKMAQQQPNACAVRHGKKTLTYAQLVKRSNTLAHHLLAHKEFDKDSLFGLCFDRSPDMLVAMLAILKAGAGYVPLDASYPTARLQYMIEDAGLTTIITQKRHQKHAAFAQHDLNVLVIDDPDFKRQLTQYTKLPAPRLERNPQALAYVIYTSGTTGNPKGVMVEHAQLGNFLLNVKQRYNITPADNVLQFSTINFDIAVEEIFGALCYGATLVLRNETSASDPQAFFKLCFDQNITVLSLPTAFWHQLLGCLGHNAPYDFVPAMRMVIVGGEALKRNMTDVWFEHYPAIELVNTYGPTETTVTACGFHLHQAYSGTGEIPIGSANINTQLYVLNAQLQPVPQGALGELYVGGNSVSRGYLNQPELTEASFIQSPFNNDPADILYRTGDQVRLSADNQLEFIQRIDDQLKIRGYRIEPSEIETVMQGCTGINQSLVTIVDNKLVGYFTADTIIDVTYLNQQLAKKLAEHMVPSAVVQLNEIPLTINGKVDKKSLPAPTFSAETQVKPRTTLEATITQIWQQVLGLDTVGINDNFFALGGHSLLVVQVLSALRKQQLIVDAAQLFATPTPAGLAAVIEKNSEQSGDKTVAYKAPENAIPTDCQTITPDMLPLIDLSQADIDEIANHYPGGHADIQDIYPLAPLQQGLLFHHTLDPDNDPYVMQVFLSIKGSAAYSAFLSGLQQVVQRHDVLRTAILWRDRKTPVQVVNRQIEVPVTLVESVEMAKSEQNLVTSTINLEQAPMLSLTVYHNEESDEYVIRLLNHHLVFDQVSVQVIEQELAAIVAGQLEKLTPPRQYREFVAHAAEQAKKRDESAFFSQMLKDVTEPTLPFGLATLHKSKSHKSNTHESATLTSQLSVNIRQQAKAMSVSPAVFFHAAWAMVVAQCSGREDIVFGTVMSGRLQGVDGVESMMGMFINTLPLRVTFEGQSVSALLNHIDKSLQALLPYEQASLALAQQCSSIPRGQPLFSAILNYRHATTNQQTQGMELAGFEVLKINQKSHYPFALSVDDIHYSTGSDFVITAEIDTTVDAEQVLGYLQTALENLTSNSGEIQLSELSLPSPMQLRIPVQI